MLCELRKIEQRKHEVDCKTQDLEKLISSVNKKNDGRVILKINRNRKRNCDAIPVRSTKFDPNVKFKLFHKSTNLLQFYIYF